MAGVTESRTYNSLLTTTLADFERKIEDQIFDVYPLLSYLNGRLGIAVRGATVKEILDGGESIVVHLLFEENSTVDSYTGAGVIDTTLQEGHTIGRYNWKQYAGTVGITGLEKRSNMGEARLINLIEAKIQQLVLSFQSRMSEDAYSDGTGNGGLNLTGLEAIVDDSASLAGLDPASFAWWKSTETASGSFAAQGINDMRTMFNTLSWGNDKPDIMFTTQDIFEFYEKSLQPQERFVGNAAADAGFMNLTFKNVPVVFDRDCTSGVMYFLNSRYIALKVHQDADMKTSEFVEPENQDVTTSKMIWQGNITTNNRRRLGKLTGITA